MEPQTGLILCPDGKYRPPWATVDELHQNYYDQEWGKAVRDETGVFERLSLEGFQAGLSWTIILQRRPIFRAAFDNFHPDTVAAYTHTDIDRIMGTEGMIRNQRKIEAVITNAALTIELRDSEHGVLNDLIWSFAPTEHHKPKRLADIPTVSEESIAMAKKLKQLGFTFVGPKICYALMQAIGLVDDRVEQPSRG